MLLNFKGKVPRLILILGPTEEKPYLRINPQEFRTSTKRLRSHLKVHFIVVCIYMLRAYNGPHPVNRGPKTLAKSIPLPIDPKSSPER